MEESNFGRYVEAFYFMTTTITSVGYGSDDYKGFISADGGGHYIAEMLYVSLNIFCGILLFAIVKNEIFSYKKLASVH